MTSVRTAAIAAVAFVLGAQPLVAQELSRYREFSLGSNVASVVTITGARQSEARTPHGRLAAIQELEWRTPYASSGSGLTDPVRDVLFSFCDDQLYRVVVTYDRDRTEGLTNDDVIESLSARYGTPLLLAGRTAGDGLSADAAADTTVVARWDEAATSVTLTRGLYPPQFQLVLISKTLQARASAAIAEALRLETQEAPQRELDRRTKETADARVASQAARVINKATFRP